MIIINDGHMFPSGNKLYSLQQNEANASVFLPVSAWDPTRMCLQQHNHLPRKYCAQVQYLSWNHRADFLMFHWTSPVLRRDLRQDRNGESSCSSKCKEKEFTLRRELLNNLLKKLLIHRNISDQIFPFHHTMASQRVQNPSLHHC